MSGRSWLVVAGLAVGLAGICGCAVEQAYIAPVERPGGAIVFAQAAAQDSDAYAAGRKAAEQLRARLNGTEPAVVLMAECFEDEGDKSRCLAGVCSVLPKDRVFGLATYGSFSQGGCLDADSAALAAIGGDGVGAAAAMRAKLGVADLTMEEHADEVAARLRSAGAELALKLPRRDDDRLLILMADAHSPKNGFLVEGVQPVFGAEFPMTGGSANKNAGQTFVYYRGRMYTDAAVAVLLSGDFKVAMSGRQARDNAMVIATAMSGASEARRKSEGEPIGVLAFNCAGRKGKLDNIVDELEAMQSVLGTQTAMFGVYCAGEIGPPDTPQTPTAARIAGVGWHLMVTIISR